MSGVSFSRIEACQAAKECRLKWQLQGGEPGSRPLVDLREYDRLPARLDRVAGKVQLLTICITPRFQKENKSNIQSLSTRVKLQCFVVPVLTPRRGALLSSLP